MVHENTPFNKDYLLTGIQEIWNHFDKKKIYIVFKESNHTFLKELKISEKLE